MTADQSRFANVSTQDIKAREREALREYHAIADALKARMLSECTIEVGKVYNVVSGRYHGRTMKVVAVQPVPYWPDLTNPLRIEVQGRLNMRGGTPTDDGFTRRIAVVKPTQLEPKKEAAQ